VDKSPAELLIRGIDEMGLAVEQAAIQLLWRYASELLRWNERVNLTGITVVEEVVEKHLLDSLAVLVEVGSAGTVLDLGAGAGLPGIPLALARPDLFVTPVDAVGRKVAFMKSAVAHLGLVGRVAPRHLHLTGAAERDGLARGKVLISRAFRDVAAWVALAKGYLEPGGRIVAMVGAMPSHASLAAVAAEHRLRVLSERQYRLPSSGDRRSAVVFSE
jgi:16S rRNA (guanine527-N7)-methyltransferase